MALPLATSISSGSAAENAGTAHADVTDDFDRVSRSDPPDNGAFEIV